MTADPIATRWAPGPPPDELGTVLHGPVIIARSPGIVAGIRCVFGHSTGLSVLVVVRAAGVQAEAASRQHRDHEHPERWSQLTLTATVDHRFGPVLPGSSTSTSNDDEYAEDGEYWIGALPADGRLTLGIAWPEAGLAAGEVTLTLTGMDRLATAVVPLL